MKLIIKEGCIDTVLESEINEKSILLKVLPQNSLNFFNKKEVEEKNEDSFSISEKDVINTLTSNIKNNYQDFLQGAELCIDITKLKLYLVDSKKTKGIMKFTLGEDRYFKIWEYDDLVELRLVEMEEKDFVDNNLVEE